MTAPADIQPPVYTGVWTNWSIGGTKGLTLTLTQQNGALLITFTALFIAYTSALLWRLACFAMHHFDNSVSQEDGLYHQKQAVLRNSSSGAAGMWNFAKLLWAWRSRDSKPYIRMLPMLAFCTTYWFLFTSAGVFSSQLSSMMGDEVLISSPNCGRFNAGVDTDNEGEPQTSGLMSSFIFPRTEKANSYARNCYGSPENPRDLAECKTFVKSQLPFDIQWNASCPFNNLTCASGNQNIMTDVRVNTLTDLRLNTKPADSLDIRWLNHCAPLETDGFKEVVNVSNTESYTKYLYGPCVIPECLGRKAQETFSVKNRDPRTQDDPALAINLRPVKGFWRQIWNTLYVTQNGSTSPASSFQPNELMTAYDGDVLISGMIANNAYSMAPIDDPWYAAHQVYESDNFTYYFADEPVSPLACKMQIQICQPNGGPCSKAEGILDAYHRRARGEQQDKRSSMLLRIFQLLSFSWLADVPELLKTRSLQITGVDNFLGNVSADQWKADVVFWQQQFLAGLQGSMIDGATGTTDKLDDMWKLVSPEHKEFCAQKMRSQEHLNFSVVCIAVIYALGVIIIFIEWSLEPILQWNDTRKQHRSYKLAEWRTYDLLQILRLAHEGVESGNWTKCNQAVPVCGAADRLARIDMGDPSHTRLSIQTATIPVVEIGKGAQILGNDGPSDTTMRTDTISA